MTETAEVPRCRWCGRSFTRSPGRGRPRQFCTQACRQKDYISRLRAQEAGLSEAELVVTRQALDDLRDRLYVLEAAVEDVESDLEAAATEQELREALQWILAAARPLSGGADLT